MVYVGVFRWTLVYFGVYTDRPVRPVIPVIPVIPVQRQCLVMSLVVGIQGQKAYGLCKTPLCAELVVQFSP